MVEISRKMRKQEAAKVLAKRIKITLLGAVLVLILGTTCYLNNILAFTVLTVIIFFGMLSVNPSNFKRFIPGLTISNRWLKFIIMLIYLITAMALISQLRM